VSASLQQEIAKQVRALRIDRGLTQSELSKILGLSQGRYSEIERGQGSFSAEQFIEILRLFNVPVSQFAGIKTKTSGDLQNALARLGASHLHEDASLLPSEQLERVEDVIRETLLEASSARQITALAPVIVQNLARVNLNKLWARFVDYRLEQRLAWLLESTLHAVRGELATSPSRKRLQILKHAELVLNEFLNRISSRAHELTSERIHDSLGTPILSEKTKREVERSSSEVARRWGILTNIQPDDFAQALKAAHDSD
jgi:transcriptional regulator with XRE-family HTH domain